MGTAASMATLRNIALQELTQPEDGSDLETLKGQTLIFYFIGI